MLGRGRWCLLAGALLAGALVAGQDRSSESVLRLTRPPRALPVDPVPFPPFRRPVPRPPIITNPGFGFPQLTRAAGMIFAGSVTRVRRATANSGQVTETVAITFRVDSGIHGVAAGRELTITQWAGLWSFGQRYRVGERVLLFLYPRSKLGLTSWVGGPLGRFALDASGHVVLTPQQMEAFRTDSVLGGKSRLPLSDFALAVRRSGEEE